MSMQSNDGDKLLIDRAQGGDKSAFEALVRKYQDRVYNICRYMLGPADAEDAAQDSFVKAYRNIGAFTPSPGFCAWVTRITINTCLDYKRRPRHLPLARISSEGDEYDLDEPFSGPGPEDLLASRQAGAVVEQAILRLSEKLRASLVLHEIEGFSYEEMASALGISIGTVKSRLFRAREELKKLLDSAREHL